MSPLDGWVDIFRYKVLPDKAIEGVFPRPGLWPPISPGVFHALDEEFSP